MVFKVLLGLITLSIAGVAAFFSIYGLAAIFSGVFWPVVIMGGALESGKLIATSFVYRYWNNISILLKTYLISAIIILMIITSTGIFGFLSMGYQQDVLPLKQQEQQIVLLTAQRAELQTLKDERIERKKQIDLDISNLPNNYVTGRQRLMKSYKAELDQIKSDIQDYTTKILNLSKTISEIKSEQLVSQVHIGPIMYIASVFGLSIDDATKWLILLIIFVFDPLAVILTIGLNIALHTKPQQLSITPSSTEDNTNISTVTDLLSDVEELKQSESETSEIVQSIIEREETKKKLRT